MTHAPIVCCPSTRLRCGTSEETLEQEVAGKMSCVKAVEARE